MIALQSTSRFLQYQSDCEICEILLLQCKCDTIFDSIEELKHPHGIEIRSRDSIIIPLMIEKAISFRCTKTWNQLSNDIR